MSKLFYILFLPLLTSGCYPLPITHNIFGKMSVNNLFATNIIAIFFAIIFLIARLYNNYKSLKN